MFVHEWKYTKHMWEGMGCAMCLDGVCRGMYGGRVRGACKYHGREHEACVGVKGTCVHEMGTFGVCQWNMSEFC